MRDLFPGSYSPTPDEFVILIKDAVIVLDTSALLSLYKIPEKSRAEALDVLDAVAERLWLPFHAALEFQNNRLNVIATEQKRIGEIQASLEKALVGVRAGFDSLEVDKRVVQTDTSGVIQGIDTLRETLSKVLNEVRASLLDVVGDDSVRARIDRLYAGRIGSAPATQADVEGLVAGADKRFELRVPPGFLDSNKDKNPNEREFSHAGLTYTRKFGDLIIWRQLLAHVSDGGAKRVLLVTEERKEDWWQTINGKTIGPQPALIQEIVGSGCESFWMYSIHQFLQFAKEVLHAPISDSSLQEIAEVSDREARLQSLYGGGPAFYPAGLREPIRAVALWLQRRGLHVNVPRGNFPTFVTSENWGFEVVEGVSLRDPREGGTFEVPQLNAVREKGRDLVRAGSLKTFTAIVLLSEEECRRVRAREPEFAAEAYLSSGIANTALVVGVVVDGNFEFVIAQEGGGLERPTWGT